MANKGQNPIQNSDQDSDQDHDQDEDQHLNQLQDSQELKELRFKRGQLKASVTRLQTTLNSLRSNQINPIDLRNRRTKLDQTWDTYDEVQTRIELITEDIGESSASERKIFEESYYTALAKIDSLILPTITTNSVASSNSQQSTGSTIIQTEVRQSNNDVRLPKVELPSFNGSYDSWSRFRDTFESLVHNNTRLSDIQKFHYLLSSVRDEAAEILESVEIAAANYEDAWKLVKDRYENKLLIVQENVKAIFELPVITKDNRADLRILVNGVRKRLSALKRLERPVDSWDDLIIHIVTSKIDRQSHADWTDTLEKGKLPKLKTLLEFLDHKCETLESMARATHSSSMLGATKSQGKSKNSGNSKSFSKKGTSSHFSSNQSSTCPMCKGSHPVYACNNFREMTPEQRNKQVKSLKICTNCLRSSSHTSNNCEFGACKKCNKKHNTLLHINSHQQKSSAQQEGESTSSTSTNQQAIPVTSANLSRQQTTSQQVLLPTARINVYDKHGHLHECRALLDSGSQSNFISRDLAKRLGLSQKPTSFFIAGIGNSSSQANTFTQIRIKSRFNAYIADLDCLILNEITGNLPVSSLNVELEIPQGIKLADPDFNKSAPIDLLIGAEIFWELLCVGQLRPARNHPALQKTQLGWVVSGKSETWPENHSAKRICNLAIADERQLATVMSRFFRLEHNPFGNTFTPEERYCESYYEQTTKRAQDQRFIVHLPIRQNTIKGLGQTEDIALKRFLSLEKKLNHNPDLKKKYTEFIHEYKDLGHMQQVKDSTSTASSSKNFYLPHHPVIKESSQTTKLRVVFDGSCKSSTGVSLNDTLMVGPTLQQDLFSILVRFRTFQVTLKADIAKMYRQILVDRSETPLQRILWRDNPTDDIQTYELLTVTYGTASGSYLAIKTLHHLANLEKDSFPKASAILLRDFYVDDLLTGADTVEEARIIRDELIALLKRGGFDLRQWSSNSQEILQDMRSDPSADSIFSLDKEETTKTLGIQWNSREDAFQYSIPIAPKSSTVTKRTMLSSIAQIFDPLGLLGPVIISAKILMQRLWQLQIDWDQSVPLEIHTKWTEYQAELQALNHLKIPRKIINKSVDSDIEIHGFSDACQEAYGACIYIRCSNRDGTHSTQLICSKSRVAPLKNISLPRLELCGALLLAQITSRVKEVLNIDIKKTYYWTDSTVVLNWISSSSRKWNTFVANRVGEIHDLTLRSEWHHVGGTDNPADIISRGMGCSQLLQAPLWWQGPAWLSQDQSSWPKSKFIASEETLELKKNVVTLVTASVDFNLINRFSSFTRLIRVTAYILRFSHNASSKNSSKLSGYLTTSEINQATNCLIKMIQREAFKNEYHALLNKRDIPKKSQLLGLNPFLDKDGIIRVGGRIQRAQLPYAAKCQIILPAKHSFTNLLIEYEHKRNLHAGTQGTLAAIRTKYWPLAAKGSIISSIRRCIKCFRNSPSTTQYIMGDLPSRRLTPARPFTNCGVDYCGPIMIREGRRRNSKLVKAYISIFVCFATKAIHIELVGDLTTEAFLCALKRLISRRGRVANIYSDNGTNFIGANNELQELRLLFEEEDHMRKISSLGMEEEFTWHFIPPRAPNFGGLWEAAVKSTKTHLKRVIGEAHLTYEEMYTLLVQIESILNSRPLTPMSNDPNDLSFLTPGHFLIGDSFRSLPEPDLKKLTLNSLSRWQHIEYIKQHFWARWYKEYLNQYQQRSKWRVSNSEPLAVGQMVIIREDNLPPLRWLLGRVEKIYPGSDGIARAASVKTAKSTFDRPANKLCILPIKDNQNSIS